MSQNNISFEGSMSGASMLDDRLTPLLNNIYSSNSGSTRPSYLQAGGTWFDSANGKLMLFNGVSEVALLAGSEGFADKDLSNLSETGQAIIDGKASVDLSNLSETGQAIIDGKCDLNLGNSTAITNCITSASQNIKLDLNNGTMTLKAGSKVCVPNGFESDGTTLKFDTVTIESDVSQYFAGVDRGQCLVFYQPDANALGWYPTNECVSGTTQSGSVFYNTSTNTISFITESKRASFPLGVIYESNGSGITSIDQTFNGFGYIGNTIFALPNVKGLIPNGRNADGSLKNTEFETTNVLTHTVTSGYNGYIVLNSITLSGWNINNSEYDFKNNINEYYGTKSDIAIVGTFSTDSTGRIISFNPKLPFQAVDRSDGEWVAHNAVPSDRYIDLTLEASGTVYTAQSDGVVSLAGTNDWVDIGIRATGRGSCSQGRSFDNFSRHDVQVKKGDKFTVFYGELFAKNHFRFIYTEGAK